MSHTDGEAFPAPLVTSVVSIDRATLGVSETSVLDALVQLVKPAGNAVLHERHLRALARALLALAPPSLQSPAIVTSAVECLCHLLFGAIQSTLLAAAARFLSPHAESLGAVLAHFNSPVLSHIYTQHSASHASVMIARLTSNGEIDDASLLQDLSAFDAALHVDSLDERTRVPLPDMLDALTARAAKCAEPLLSRDPVKLSSAQKAFENAVSVALSIIASTVHREHINDSEKPSLLSLVRLCVQILTQSACTNDALYLCGLFATRGALLLLPPSPSALLLAYFTLSSPAGPQTSPVAQLLHDNAAIQSLRDCNTTTQVSLLRALVVVLGSEKLGRSALVAHVGSTTLLLEAFNGLAFLCETCPERFRRLVALQGVDACVRVLVDVTKGRESELDTALVRSVMTATLRLLCAQCNDSLDAMVAQGRNTLSALLALHSLAPSVLPDFANLAVNSLLGLEVGSKGRYTLISTLAAHVGALVIVESHPEFIQSLLDALNTHVALGHQVGKCFGDILKRLANRGLSEADIYNRFVRSAVLTAFTFSGDPEPFTLYSLPAITSALPTALSLLVADTLTPPLSDIRMLSLLSLLRLARTKSIALAWPTNTTLSFTEFIEAALYHGDVRVRHSLFDLVCNATGKQRNYLPTATEINIVEIYLATLDASDAVSRETRTVTFRRFLERIRTAVARSRAMSVAESARRCIRRVAAIVLAHVHPGSSAASVAIYLDLYSVLLDVVNPVAALAPAIDVSTSLPPLIAAVRSETDKARAASLAALSHVPVPWSCGLEALLNSCVKDLSAVRLAPSTAASQLLATVATSHVLHGPSAITLVVHKDTPLPSIALDPVSTLSKTERVLNFLNSLIFVAKNQLSLAHASFLSPSEDLRVSEFGLHGSIRALRFLLAVSVAVTKAMSFPFEDLLQLALSVMQSMRSFTDALTYNNATSSNFHEAFGSQHVFVSSIAWQSIYEACLLISDLVKQLPLPLLKTHAELIGQGLLDTLLGVVHKGIVENVAALQSLCEVLFRSKDSALAQLPRKWLTQHLLIHINSDNTASPYHYALTTARRSAALPFSVCAILRAETATSKSRALLSSVLNTIVSAIETSSDEVVRVHALHTLRAIFLDRQLVDDLSEDILTRTATLLFTYFASTNWSTRSAAMLAFSALLQRLTGLKNPGPSRRGKTTKGLTLSSFLNRYPRMIDVFLSFLRSSAPFAALVFLSSLSPARLNDPRESNISALLSAPLKELTSTANWHVRDMVATAFVPLLSAGDVDEHLEKVFAVLGTPEKVSLNQVHGLLRQIKHLHPQWEVPGSELISRLLSLRQLIAQPSPSATEYLTLICESVEEISTEEAQSVRALVLDLVAQCLKGLEPPALLRAAAYRLSLTACVKAGSHAELVEHLARSQRDSSRAVRLAGLLALIEGSLSSPAITAVTDTLLARLGVTASDAEDDFECVGVLLSLLLRSLSTGGMHIEALAARLGALMEDSRFTTVKTECMRCYAIAIESSSTLSSQALSNWLNLLEQSIDDEEEKRLFALDSLERLLGRAKGASLQRVWVGLIRLAQDSSLPVRLRTGAAIAQHLKLPFASLSGPRALHLATRALIASLDEANEATMAAFSSYFKAECECPVPDEKLSQSTQYNEAEVDDGEEVFKPDDEAVHLSDELFRLQVLVESLATSTLSSAAQLKLCSVQMEESRAKLKELLAIADGATVREHTESSLFWHLHLLQLLLATPARAAVVNEAELITPALAALSNTSSLASLRHSLNGEQPSSERLLFLLPTDLLSADLNFVTA